MNAAKSCVAVVDDEVAVRTALGRLLRLADYDVIAFASGEEFLAALDTRRPDCVVLDLHMPGLSGLEVQTQMRARYIDLPAVFITASDDPALIEAVRQGGGVRLLHKPFPNNDLIEALSAALHA